MTQPAAADVIIIGSGPAGVSAAWPLVGAGIRVLMLDAANGDLPAAPQHASLREWRDDPLRWRAELGAEGALADARLSPKFSTPLGRAALAGFGRAAGLESDNFFPVGSLAAGGLSRIWGALAAQYGPADLVPFGDVADEIRAGYRRVADRIGLDHEQPPPGKGQAHLTPAAARFAARYTRSPRRAGFALTTAPNAVLSMPRGERRACTACGLCLQGCSRDSIYHSASEIPALRRFRNFDYRTNVLVERLAEDANGHVVVARTHGERIELCAPTILLAAGTLMTSSLALRRLGMAGRRVALQTNPVGGIAFLLPSLIGTPLPDRSFGLGQLFYTLDMAADAEAAGVIYGADTLPLAPIADRLPFTRHTALRTARALAPALLLATSYLPGRFSANHLVVEDGDAGARIRIEGRQTDLADAMLRRSFCALARQARRLGAWAVPGSAQVLMPGADAHPTSTLPMGGAHAAATRWSGELNGVPGVYVVDGAALPILSARHPTLTIMANADRIGRSLARRLPIAPRIHAARGRPDRDQMHAV